MRAPIASGPGTISAAREIARKLHALPILRNLADLVGLRPEAESRPGLLALDVSKRAVGIAGADPTWRLATPLTTIRRRRIADDLTALARIVAERGAGVLVVGWPLNMDGSEGPRCQSVLAFARAVEHGLGLPVLLWDERLTTFAAEELAVERGLKDKRRRRGSPDIDALAAAAILQDLLDALARRERAQVGRAR